MSITREATRVLSRVTKMARLAGNVHTELLRDQADAVAPGHSEGGSGSSDISDPTYRRMVDLAPYAKMDRDIHAALRSIDRAMDDAEVVFQRVLSDSARLLGGHSTEGEPRCPGWSDERRARLGGCGNHLATYRDAKGNDHPRPEYLCHSCLKEKRAAEREEGAA